VFLNIVNIYIINNIKDLYIINNINIKYFYDNLEQEHFEKIFKSNKFSYIKKILKEPKVFIKEIGHLSKSEDSLDSLCLLFKGMLNDYLYVMNLIPQINFILSVSCIFLK